MRTQFQPSGLDEQLRVARAALAAGGNAEPAVWEFPPGPVPIPAGTVLGAPGRDLEIAATGTIWQVDPGPADGPALRLVGRRTRLTGGTVLAGGAAPAGGAGSVVGLWVQAAESWLDGVGVAGLRGDRVTGLVVHGQTTRITGLGVRDLRGTVTADAVDIDVTGRVELAGAVLRSLTAARVHGLRVRAPGGFVRDVIADDLQPGDIDGLTTMSIAGTIAAAGLGAVRDLRRLADPDDVLAALAAAQAGLAASPANTQETWLLPAVVLAPAGGLLLGVPNHGLTLTGRRTPTARTELRVGVGAPFVGSLTALDLTGQRVRLSELVVSAEATGAVTAVRCRAPEVEVADLTVRAVRGDSATGLDVDAGTGAVGVTDLIVDDLAGAAGTATGARIGGDRVVIGPGRISTVSGPGRAIGLRVTARGTLSARATRTTRIDGSTAVGMLLRMPGDPPPGGPGSDGLPVPELAALELSTEQVTAAAGAATGIALIGAGDVSARGLRVTGVAGTAATGALLAAAGELDWSGGYVEDVRGADAAAAGARLLVRPSPAAVTVTGVRVEAVAGAVPGVDERPPHSWSDLLMPGRDDWFGATGSDLPAGAGPGHADEVVGLAVIAPAFEGDAAAPGGRVAGTVGPVTVGGCGVRRVSGTALQIEGEARRVAVRGIEVATVLRGGWLDGDDVLLAQSTWHRTRTGVRCGPAVLRAVDLLLTDVEVGLPLIGADHADAAAGSFVGRSEPPPATSVRVAPVELGQPVDLSAVAPVELYRRPGPGGPLPAEMQAGGLAAQVDLDLRLLAGHELHRRAVRVPGDDDSVPRHVGAWPDTAARCTLRDPLAVPETADPPRPTGGPLVDYRARDAESLLGLMLDRARITLPDWPASSPADFTRMLLELLANRLDLAAYRQESAVAEGYIGTARLRRSVEDHARLVDYRPDPGLSATAMLRFDVTPEDAATLGLAEAGSAFTVPADTVVVNRDPEIEAVVFATEDPLVVDLRLRSLRPVEDLPLGSTSAVLADGPPIPVGRWLVIAPLDPAAPVVDGAERVASDLTPHVVRVVASEIGAGGTRVYWDFRRALPFAAGAASTRVFGNVVPAHHGIPLAPGADGWGDFGETLRPWRSRLTVDVDNRDGTAREVDLPAGPVAVQAAGWPFPGTESGRTGRARVSVLLDDEPWEVVDTLTGAAPGDEHVVLRSGADGGPVLRFGDGVNGAALPLGDVRLLVHTRVGGGARGNVGAGVLSHVLAYGVRGDLLEVLPKHPDRRELIAAKIRVGNPLPAIGGRDPEPVERIRAAAPLTSRRPGSAIVPADYERIALSAGGVAGVRARFRRTPLRDVVEVTALLRGEDELTAAGDAGTAERLRRWAAVRTDLETARLLGTDVELLPPVFVPLDVDLDIEVRTGAAAEQARVEVTEALAGPGGLFDPDVAGLGGDVRVDDIYRAALRVPSVAAVRVRRLRRLVGGPEYMTDGVLPVAGGDVAVLRDPLGRRDRDGVLTVTVCGGVR